MVSGTAENLKLVLGQSTVFGIEAEACRCQLAFLLGPP